MILLYDLREPGAFELSRTHRNYWGKLYTDVYALDEELEAA